MRKIITPIALLLAVLLAACSGTRSTPENVAQELGVSLPETVSVGYEDTHGGFHGDGISCYAYTFSDDSCLQQVSQADGWSAFPLDETAEALLYGITKETDSGTSYAGPFFTYENQDTCLVPPIENGYYCLVDRHSDAGTPGDEGLLARGSFNCTMAVYDADAAVFYFCELDT